ncbi:hypothetical protein D3C72_844360 [compost metagenome]
MSKAAWHLVLFLLVAGTTAGCDTHRWIGQTDSQVQPAASATPRLSPAFSQSGRVEAGVLSPFGSAPDRQGQPAGR